MGTSEGNGKEGSERHHDHDHLACGSISVDDLVGLQLHFSLTPTRLHFLFASGGIVPMHLAFLFSSHFSVHFDFSWLFFLTRQLPITPFRQSVRPKVLFDYSDPCSSPYPVRRELPALDVADYTDWEPRLGKLWETNSPLLTHSLARSLFFSSSMHAHARRLGPRTRSHR